VGAENGVTAADLVFAVARWVTELGIWLREQAGSGSVSTRVTATGAYLAVLRLFGWLAIRLVVYFSYSVKHSRVQALQAKGSGQ
jgi:hypothetical protein